MRAFSPIQHLLFLFASVLIFACQPQTKQDRAGVGPDVVSTPFDGAPKDAPQDSSASQDGSSTLNNIAVGEWEKALKTLCEQGRPSACSQLAYELQRSQKNDEAMAYFTRACLMDGTPAACSQPQIAQQGLARSCAELSPLYLQKKRPEDATVFKKCACDRGFKPACL